MFYEGKYLAGIIKNQISASEKAIFFKKTSKNSENEFSCRMCVLNFYALPAIVISVGLKIELDCRADYFDFEMKTKERYQFVIEYFTKEMPVAETELEYNNPFQLLVAVILSAQCTDKRVNMVTPELFRHFPDAASLSQAEFDEVFALIKSISYPNNKAKHLIGMAKMLVEQFDSQVPGTVEELVRLPGVGRKTANVIASVVFEQPTMAVDTHVFRVSRRIGLAKSTSKTPLSVEMDLYRHLPKSVIPKAHHWLILHGRYVCLARKPKCGTCGLQPVCKYFQKNPVAEV